MNQQRTFAQRFQEADAGGQAAFLLGRAVAILEGLIESPTDALDIKMAEEFLADYRKWRDEES